MPRKPKPPPVYDMLVEGLSAVLAQAQHEEPTIPTKEFEDDFEPGVMHTVVPEIAQRIERRARVIEDYKLKLKAQRIVEVEAIVAQTERRIRLTESILTKQLTPKLPLKPFKRRL